MGNVELIYDLQGNAYYEFNLKTSKKAHKRRTGDGAIDRRRRHNDAKNVQFWDCEQPRYNRPVKGSRGVTKHYDEKYRAPHWEIEHDSAWQCPSSEAD